MQKFDSVSIELKTPHTRIAPSSTTERYNTRNYLIFGTNFSQYHIKAYKNIRAEFNSAMMRSDLETTELLLSKSLFPIKILEDKKRGKESEFLFLLTDSFYPNFREMVQMASLSHEFDLLKFFVQIGKYLIVCADSNVRLLQLGEDSVVMDQYGNFQLANLDLNLTVIEKDNCADELIGEMIARSLHKSESSRERSPLAPEVAKSRRASSESMIWDVGVLALRAFAGCSVRVNYHDKTVDLAHAEPHAKTDSQCVLFDLIRRCLRFEPGERISAAELVGQAGAALAEASGFFSAVNSSLLRDAVKAHNGEVQQIIGTIGDLMASQTPRIDRALVYCSFEKVDYPKEMSVKSMVKVLTNPSELIHDAISKELVRRSWDVPVTIVQVYSFVKSRIDGIVRDEQKTMKLLLMLHNLIFKGSSNTLIVYMKSDRDENSVNLILERVIRAFADRKQGLIFGYAYLLYLKFNLQLKLVGVLQNNFSVTRHDLIHKFQQLLAPEVLRDLFGFLRLGFALFLSLRKFSFDYFYRNFLVMYFKETTGLLGLLSNMAIYLLFGLTVLERESALSGQQVADAKRQLGAFLEAFDFMVMANNIYIEQARRRGYESFRYFKVKKDLHETFERIRLRMAEELSSDPAKSTPEFFAENYLDGLLKMNESYSSAEESGPTRDSPSRDFKSSFKQVILRLIESKNLFRNLSLGVGRLLPSGRRWYELNMKLITGRMHSNSHNMATNMLTEFVINQADSSMQREASVDAKAPKVTPNTGAKELNPWVINYEELDFGDLVPSNSPYTVHKGVYRGSTVAIKKLPAPSNAGAKKQLTRKLTRLILVSQHPNLATMLGFCIREKSLFLVTESCEELSLFDIIHWKQTGFKLSFRQKVKILLDVVRAVYFLHQQTPQVVHGYLKSLNVFIGKSIEKGSVDFEVKLAGFELAALFDKQKDVQAELAGNCYWMAPECFSGKPFSTKTDAYAFAVLAWEMFAEKHPLENQSNSSKVIKYVYYQNKRPDIKECTIDERFEKDIAGLIKKNWQKNDAKRSEFDQVYQVLSRVYEKV